MQKNDQITTDLSDQLTERVETIKQSVDEEAIADAVAQNTELLETEAASKASIWSFVALILTMILTSIAGIAGLSAARRGETVNR